MSFRVAGARDCAPCQKVSKTWGFCSMSKSDGRRGTFEEDLQRCIFRGRRSTRDTFSWQALYLRQVEWTKRKTHWYEAVSAARNFPCLKEVSQNWFVYWSCQLQKLRKSHRIASFLMVSTLKIKEVSQTCFVFDVVKFKNWGSLAE